VHTGNSSSSDTGSKEPKRFLIGLDATTRGIISCCPNAQSLRCLSVPDCRETLFALPCNQWTCRWCGQRKAFQLAIRTEQAAPTRFLTLTTWSKLYASPADAYGLTRRKIADFGKVMRQHVGEFEYLRVLEATARGWPHYHLAVRSPYIPQSLVSETWSKLTGNKIVDIRKINQSMNVFKYMLKYLCKQTHVPWTNRRIGWSKKFFPPKEPEPEQTQGPVNKAMHFKHPATILNQLPQGTEVTEIRPGFWQWEA
jgi:hypothetical protein